MRLPRLLTFALAAAPISSAFADDTHFRPYIVGSRAAGMGGAFTALSDDASGSYYNPGGLAFTRRSSVSLTGSVYGLSQGKYEDFISGQDLSASDVQVFPVSTAGLLKFGQPQADGISNHTFSFGVFVPDAAEVSARAELGSNENVVIVNQESQTLWAGAGYAYRAGRVGLGFMLYGVQGTENSVVDASIYDPQNQTVFVNITGRQESNWFGALAAAGVRWNPDDTWSLGASVYSPALGFGSAETFVRVNFGLNDFTEDGLPFQGVEAAEDLESGPTIPLRAQLGVAYSRPRFTLAADLIFLAPLKKTFEEGGTFESILDRQAVLNGSIGGEFLVTEAWPIRAGLFTDFSAAQDPEDVAGTPDEPENTYDVDRVGATLSVGYRSEHVVTDLGLNASVGSGQDSLPKDLDFTRNQPVDASERRLYVFLATTYEF